MAFGEDIEISTSHTNIAMNHLICTFLLYLLFCFFVTETTAQKLPQKRKIFKKTANLDQALNETSGLIYVDGYIWTHNDGGDEPALYKIDTKSGKVTQKLLISNAKNVDWEDITQDEKYIYIGDFGNNYGMRTNLTIYKIKRSALSGKNSATEAEIITFVYPEQTDFKRSNTHNFDCEGFFALNGELHLFTKNRGDGMTQHYTLPTSAGNHKAQLQMTFNTKGQITAADISPDGKTVILTGYTPRKLFMWIYNDYIGTQFFSGKYRRICMGRFVFRGQMEGVCFSGNDKGYISAEQVRKNNFIIKRQHLRYFSIDKFLQNN